MATRNNKEPSDLAQVGIAFDAVGELDKQWPAGVSAGLALAMLRVAARLWMRSGLDGAAFVDACSVAWRHAREETKNPSEAT